MTIKNESKNYYYYNEGVIKVKKKDTSITIPRVEILISKLENQDVYFKKLFSAE